MPPTIAAYPPTIAGERIFIDENASAGTVAEDGIDITAGWDDDPPADETETETDEESETGSNSEPGSEAGDGENQPASENAEDAEAKEQNQQPANDDSFELKYMGETKRIGREEMIALAQKGMDYDRIREERDKMSPELDGLRSDKTKLTEYEGFLAKLAESVGMDIPAMIESTQAKMLVADEAKKGNTITEDFALQRIRFEREKADFEKQKGRKDSDKPKEDGQAKAESGKQTPEEEIAKARRDDEAKAFLKEYPEVDPKTIPKEVMNKWMGGTPLINAYMVYENKKLKADLAAMEQNMKNSGRSTGSVKSAGAGRATDPVFAGWDD